jgi:hypothetical protein
VTKKDYDGLMRDLEEEAGAADGVDFLQIEQRKRSR